MPRNKFNRHQEKNSIVNSAVDEIFLQENKKVIARKGKNEKIKPDFDENKLYHIINMSLDDTKEKL